MVTPAEIAASLTMEDVPIKLRCAACNKLANEAFRMPCCDQTICDECQDSLPTTCPICLHEPVSKDDCRPNKALRTTIKAFLKRKGIEMEAARKNEAMEKAASDPKLSESIAKGRDETREASHTLVESTARLQAVGSSGNSFLATGALTSTPSLPAQSKGINVAEKDIPKESIESPGPHGLSPPPHDQTLVNENTMQEKGDLDQQHQDHGQNAQWSQENSAGPMFGKNGAGFDGVNGGFTNMGMTNNINNLGFNGVGDFNQMMQLMPNGMPNNMMGGFPNVMGMSGMGMDPMAMSQGFYGGFGGPGMGMNGMGMGFDAGLNAFGGFNGQHQTQNAFGQMGSDFGANTGYGGYNMPQHQGNFNQMQQHQNFNHEFHHGHHAPGISYRGRGRGRGNFYNAGRGRGFPQAYQGRQAHFDPAQEQSPQQPQRRGSPEYTPMVGSDLSQSIVQQKVISHERQEEPKASKSPQHVDEPPQGDPSPRDTRDTIETPKTVVEDEVAVTKEPEVEALLPSDGNSSNNPQPEHEKLKPIPSVLSAGSPIEENVEVSPTETAASSVMPPPVLPVIPTGPASQRGEFPTIVSPRGRGFGRGLRRAGFDHRPAPIGRGSLNHRDHLSRTPSLPPSDQTIQSPQEAKGLGVQGAPTAPKALRQGLPNTGIRPPQDPGFSIVGRANANSKAQANGHRKSQSPSSNRTRSRSRSRSPSYHQSSQHRHHHRSHSSSRERKREKLRENIDASFRNDGEFEDEAIDYRELRARASSADSSHKRSSHRSHRDHDKESSRSKHRSHRSHRERSRSPRDREYRSSRRRSQSPDFKINGASRIKEMTSGGSSNQISKDVDDEQRGSSRKRRDRDDEPSYRDRKRSRRDEEDDYRKRTYEESSHRSKHHSRRTEDEEIDLPDRSHADRTRRPSEVDHANRIERPQSPPKGPKIDQHALEREARNRERQMKEIQRRALMEGKGGGGNGGGSKSRAVNGRGPGERRHSYKYEDEDLASRVEKEREAGRWG